MKRASVTLFLISVWYLIPLFILELTTYPFVPYFKSHLLYIAAISISLIFAVAIEFADSKWNLWKKNGYWVKYLLVLGAYTIQMIVIFLAMAILAQWKMLAYYDSCPGGSIGMLFLPSIPLYFIIGAFWGVIRKKQN